MAARVDGRRPHERTAQEPRRPRREGASLPRGPVDIDMDTGLDHAGAEQVRTIMEVDPDTVLTFGPEGMTGHVAHQDVSRGPAKRSTRSRSQARACSTPSSRRAWRTWLEKLAPFDIFLPARRTSCRTTRSTSYSSSPGTSIRRSRRSRSTRARSKPSTRSSATRASAASWRRRRSCSRPRRGVMVERPEPVRDLDWDPKRARAFTDGVADIYEELLTRLRDLPVSGAGGSRRSATPSRSPFPTSRCPRTRSSTTCGR